MNSMTFQKEGDYIVCYINGKEVNRSKVSKAGETEQDVIDTINEQIKANPTLIGDEPSLEGLEVNGDKYSNTQHLVKINCNWTDIMYGGIDIITSTSFYSSKMPTQEMIVNYLLTGVVLSGSYNNGEVFAFFKALEEGDTTIVFLDMPWDDNPARYTREDLAFSFSIDVDDNEEVLYFDIVG